MSGDDWFWVFALIAVIVGIGGSWLVTRYE